MLEREERAHEVKRGLRRLHAPPELVPATPRLQRADQTVEIRVVVLVELRVRVLARAAERGLDERSQRAAVDEDAAGDEHADLPVGRSARSDSRSGDE